MRLVDTYDHHNAVAEWGRRSRQEWLEDVFEAPGVRVDQAGEVRQHVRAELERSGWAINVKIDQMLGLSVFAMDQDLAFHLQTGNISRAAYDLLKLQYLFISQRIEAAALAVPSKSAAVLLGSNIANFERISKELEVLDRVVTVPIVLLAFE